MAVRTITSANLVYMITIAGVVSSPAQLYGFSVDDAFSQGEVNHTELQQGVDGLVGAGWVPALVQQKFMFLASSPSIDLFETWARTNNQTKTSLVANATVRIPAVSRSYNMINGYLSGYSPMPDAKKVLGPRQFTITWTDIQPSPTA